MTPTAMAKKVYYVYQYNEIKDIEDIKTFEIDKKGNWRVKLS